MKTKTRYWIGEQHMRVRKTVLIEANSRREAMEKSKSIVTVPAVDMDYYCFGPCKIIREDKTK